MLQHDQGHFDMPISSKSPIGVFLLKEVERKPAAGQSLYSRKVFEDISPDILDLKVETFHGLGTASNPTHKNLANHGYNLAHV